LHTTYIDRNNSNDFVYQRANEVVLLHRDLSAKSDLSTEKTQVTLSTGHFCFLLYIPNNHKNHPTEESADPGKLDHGKYETGLGHPEG
jgi:hypothetical protein